MMLSQFRVNDFKMFHHFLSGTLQLLLYNLII